MALDNKRTIQRVSSHNLLSYSCFDESNNPVTQGMGRTLNVSEGGIMLETHSPMNLDNIVSISISLEDEVMDIRGKVTFSNKREDGKYESGIQFIETDEDTVRILKQFAEIFKGELTEK